MNLSSKVKKMDKKTNKKIDRSLTESAKLIDELKQKLQEDEGKLPKTALKMEDRLQDLQQELDSISDKMLAYKLRRIADSKMLASVARLSSEDDELEQAADSNASVKKPSMAGSDPPQQELIDPLSENKVKKTSDKKNNKKEDVNYQSSTFQCKSDLDQCLLKSTHPIEKALCYALFIRCAIKG